MKQPIWLQLYFVLASLLGLVLIVFGTVSLTNLILTSTVLKSDSRQFSPPPPQPYLDSAKLVDNTALTEEERKTLERWTVDYENWEKTEKDRDYEAENRRQSLAWSIAVLVTGIPIFALHAPIVFRQVNRE